MSGDTLVLFLGFVALLLAGVPIAIALGLSAAVVIADAGLGIMSIATSTYTGIAKYPLLAIPVFVLAGLIFERSGVAGRLVRLAMAIVGQRGGALGIVAVLVCMVMGGISGSGPADAAAVATVMTSSMAKAGYPRAFSASIIAAAGSTAILIPPSIAFIVYSVLVPSASVPELFAAGMVPGILAGLSLMVPIVVLSRRYGFGQTVDEDRPRFWPSLRDASWGLLAPVIILGGLRSGAFTPTEAAAVAVFYGLAVGVFVYRTIDWAGLYRLLVEAAEISAVVLMIVALASVFAWAGSTLGAFDQLAKGLLSLGLGQWGVMALVMVLLLFAGMFLDGVSIFLILLPILVPIATGFGWDLVWFGVLITMNVAIGQFTPPVAVNLMVTCKVAGIPMESTVRWVLWMVAAMATAMALVIIEPGLALWLPRALGYQ
ncbi:MAG: TRAP transporter large permease [Alphaproteobacteria bacterium]|nr:TRAP transporter large permease [Alphaproteobacteria bacterium]